MLGCRSVDKYGGNYYDNRSLRGIKNIDTSTASAERKSDSCSSVMCAPCHSEGGEKQKPGPWLGFLFRAVQAGKLIMPVNSDIFTGESTNRIGRGNFILVQLQQLDGAQHNIDLT